MSTPKFNSKSPTIKRILRESHELSSSPSPDLHAVPLETDLFEWHFTLRGPPNSPFENGIYHGRIVLPPTYPLRPPSFRFLTPSGRFEVNREICLSISGHHEETWQPAWGVRTALVALRSFMETDVKGQLGGLESSESVRKRLASESRSWTCPGGCNCGKSNEAIMKECEEACAAAGEGGSSSGRKEEEKVPEELKMGWRDEMGQQQQQQQQGKNKEAEEESDRLAEGFVQTGNPPPAVTRAGGAGEASSSAGAAAVIPQAAAPSGGSSQMQNRPVQVQAQVAAAHQQQPRLLQVQRRRVSNDDVWLDRVIIAVAVLLAAAVAKVVLV
ncbi:ubiquitin-conjugating enzyme E2 J1 [Cladorrhinum sp. PSN259]|nr:ubiquitin-conjugating enzyme E2 J1 [Cladorrhinum sp. PSN259]